MSLQDEMAKVTYVEETVLLSSGRSRKKLFLSCGGNDLENSEHRYLIEVPRELGIEIWQQTW